MQGGTVTSGLKKVTDDMKTKNRADRSGAVPSSTSAPSALNAPKGLQQDAIVSSKQFVQSLHSDPIYPACIDIQPKQNLIAAMPCH